MIIVLTYRDGHNLDLQDHIFCVILILKIKISLFLNVAYGKHRRDQVMWYFEAISWLRHEMESKLERSLMEGADVV